MRSEVISNEDTFGWFRLVGTHSSGELVTDDYINLDPNFKNRVQDLNYKLMVFDEKKLITILYAPDFVRDMTTWDLGFFHPLTKKFLTVNSFVITEELQRKTFLKFYLNLFKFLNEQDEGFNLKHRFGFEYSSSVLKLEDYVIQNQNDFIKAVYKLPIGWISANIKDNQLLQTRKAELSQFVLDLASGFKNMFGEVSFNRLNEKLKQHIGVHHSSPEKLHRTTSKTFRGI